MKHKEFSKINKKIVRGGVIVVETFIILSLLGAAFVAIANGYGHY